MRLFGNYSCYRVGITWPRLLGRKTPVFWLSFVWLFVADLSAAPAERLFFLSGGEVFQACIYKPVGKGPYPTVVFNQAAGKPLAAEGPVDPFPKVAEFFNSNGYVLFVPGRHNLNRGPVTDAAEGLERQERHVEIISSSLATLKAQSFVDAERIYMAGYSSGGTTTLYLAGKPLSVRGYVVFSPATQIWDRNVPAQKALQEAVAKADSPVFLIQCQNDFSLGPAQVLGKELTKKGPPNRSKVFPPFGNGQLEALYFAIHGAEIWGPDVLSFFKEITK